LEEEVEVAKQLITGLLERIGAKTEVEEFVKEGSPHLEIKSDSLVKSLKRPFSVIPA